MFAVLGDETRLALVSRLCAEGPLSIAKLTAGGMTFLDIDVVRAGLNFKLGR